MLHRLRQGIALFSVRIEFWRSTGIQPPFRLYDLRHTYGTRAVEAGIDVFRVAKLMGHADFKTTERYVHLSKAHLEDAQKRIERFRSGQRSR